MPEQIKEGIEEGVKIRIKKEIIEKFNIPKGEHEGVVTGFLFKGEAVIQHTNGKIYDWAYDSFEIIK